MYLSVILVYSILTCALQTCRSRWLTRSKKVYTHNETRFFTLYTVRHDILCRPKLMVPDLRPARTQLQFPAPEDPKSMELNTIFQPLRDLAADCATTAQETERKLTAYVASQVVSFGLQPSDFLTDKEIEPLKQYVPPAIWPHIEKLIKIHEMLRKRGQ